MKQYLSRIRSAFFYCFFGNVSLSCLKKNRSCPSGHILPRSGGSLLNCCLLFGSDGDSQVLVHPQCRVLMWSNHGIIIVKIILQSRPFSLLTCRNSITTITVRTKQPPEETVISTGGQSQTGFRQMRPNTCIIARAPKKGISLCATSSPVKSRLKYCTT